MRAKGLEPSRVLPHQNLNLARLPIPPRPRRVTYYTAVTMQDPFDILGVEPRFDLDDAELHHRLIALAAEHHPDRHTDPIAQADAAEQAARVNDAYRTLADPERRAQALLARLSECGMGDEGSEMSEAKLHRPSDEAPLPPEFLMEMMEIREELETAAAQEDTATIARLRTWAQDQRTQHLRTLTGLFAQLLTPARGDSASTLIPKIRLELNILRYIQRMLDQMPSRNVRREP